MWETKSVKTKSLEILPVNKVYNDEQENGNYGTAKRDYLADYYCDPYLYDGQLKSYYPLFYKVYIAVESYADLEHFYKHSDLLSSSRVSNR